MSTKIDVPLDFLVNVKARNTNEDGTLKDPDLLSRMDNDVCRACHARYQEKFPDQPFNIECQGIYGQNDYVKLKAEYEESYPGEEIAIDEIRDIYDAVFWAKRYIKVKNADGDMVDFEARWYQAEVLNCTAKYKVDRMGRGLGKTVIGVIEELHKALTKSKYDILVICPAQSQSQMWFDQILLQVESSPMIRETLVSRKQQPFFFFRFSTGSTISIFTAGSKSGRGADSVRGQSPRRVRMDEQDYLADKDYQAIMPLLRRFKESEFHGASTPTGLRGMYWQMCTRLEQYREFYFPISVRPDWNEEVDAPQLMAEAKTMDRYRHEFLAEFGDPESGVFKGIFVDRAKARGTYSYSDQVRQPQRKYFMGVDWNGRGTGTKIRVIELDLDTMDRRCVAKDSVDEADSTMLKSIERIRTMNRKWLCEDIFIDFGFGAAQDELLRLAGNTSTHPADKRLKDVKVIDFGATLEFNALVDKRDPNKKKYIDDDANKMERRTKPFMVDGSVMVFEAEKIAFSAKDDPLLEEQLRAYRVKNYSNHGYASTYEAGDMGDHDLDAMMLALLAAEMKYGLFKVQDHVRRLAKMLHATSWGVSGTAPGRPNASPEASDIREALKSKNNVPSRVADHSEREKWRMQYLIRNGANVTGYGSSRPGGVFSPSSPRVTPSGTAPSRTNIFRNRPSGPRRPNGF